MQKAMQANKYRGYILMAVAAAALVSLVSSAAVILRNQLISGRQEITRTVAENASGVVSEYAQYVNDGTISVEQAQYEAKEALRSMRYGDGNYVFITGTDGRFVMHPLKKEMEGTSATSITDKKGNHFNQEIVQKATDSGNGFVHYYWPRPGQDSISEKVSYVTLFRQWGWIVGTGDYVGDDSNIYATGALIQGGISLLLLGLVLSLSYQRQTR